MYLLVWDIRYGAPFLIGCRTEVKRSLLSRLPNGSSEESILVVRTLFKMKVMAASKACKPAKEGEIEGNVMVDKTRIAYKRS